MDGIKCTQPCTEPMSRETVRHTEKCAAFLVRMIEKYGDQVLSDLEEEEQSQQNKD